ncbi:DEAD/DEAH box helicase [Massilia cellulosiltytica]|uniref:DEAD/DEAH box helicase n=1 Tax=Massilia cellulosiltytica TaxID=2683234 RepID=UPI001923AF7A|nr:DEAD/DEAH box helicase [Telluria cellulosilytica]
MAPVFETEGVLYPHVADDALASAPPSARPALAYLKQLDEEGFITPLVDKWLLPWEHVYELVKSADHEASTKLLGLPEERVLRPILSSSGSLSDPTFVVTIQGWEGADGAPVRGALARQGAVFTLDGREWRMTEAAWKLIRAVQDLYRDQKAVPGEKTNQLGWAKIRKLAKDAHARMDGFLERTVVVRPESLKLDLRRRLVGDEQVVEVTPTFDDQPAGWLDSFERQQQVPDRYVIAQANGGVTHVLIPPDVKSVLSEVRAMPARCVAGSNASLFLKNPFAYLGPDANSVLDPDEYDASLQQAGIHFYTFELEPVLESDSRIGTVTLKLTAPSETASDVELDLNDPVTLGQFVTEVGSKLLAGLACAFWRGYELDMAGFDSDKLSRLEDLQQRWSAQAAGQELKDVFDLTQYGDRVIGIGRAEKVSSPYLQKDRSENWLPAELLTQLGLDGELLSRWETSNRDHYEQFVTNIDTASANRQPTARLPGPELDIELLTARRIATVWGERFKQGSPSDDKPSNERDVLLVAGNIDELDYQRNRGDLIRQGLTTDPDLPNTLLPATSLRTHQLQGVGWLQHLYGLSPHLTSGCILADDMGLGKTLQLLTFIAWCIETDPDGAPVLIVAPVSLLDNWEREMGNFLHPCIGEDVLKLYGRSLQEARMPKGDLPPDIRAHGIQNLLRFGWRRNKRIVLTTYETLRDQEFSLARQAWSVVICDEAQKIKNPAARVTQATKALQARFRIACTGTPVENSLTDLWCLYDWIQPGLLGSLNEFGAKFRRPIETKEQQDEVALAELRALIEPQLLRRTKQDVAKDLPDKIEDAACKSLPMSALQWRLYRSEVGLYNDQRAMQEHLGQQGTAMLGLLHKLKMICAHPHALRPEGDVLDVSPKLRWTLNTLKGIQARGEKAIIFTELRDIQRVLQFAILDAFGFTATIINGDTNSTSERGPSRQKLIDAFQEAPGFGIIILSTTAVGFGVNVQAANHVIHFTRPWNPAKEDQATDRAYRIGQQRDVYVYYPTVVADDMVTFEQTLDHLLSRKRGLATDMLNGTGDIAIDEFATYLTPDQSSGSLEEPHHAL